jgi:uroporphyrin-3 C-methyltransferase
MSSDEDASFPDIDESLQLEAPKASRFGLFLAALALLLSGGAAAGVAWLILMAPEPAAPVQQDTQALDELEASIRAVRSSVSELGNRLDDLAGRDVASSSQLRSLQHEVERQLEALGSVPARIGNLENTLSSIQGISAGARDTWLLAEAEYYMQIANAQLQLAGNPYLARLALQQADGRIQQLGNPALTNTRRALADEIQALELLETPDVEGLTLTLGSLVGVVDSLPVRDDVQVRESDRATTNDELSGMDRALASLRSTMNDVVSVRRSDEAVQPLLAPEAVYFLRTNLSLQLQTARLALLRREPDIFRQSLDDAAAWLRRYFDIDNAQVQSAVATVEEIRDSQVDVSRPDISESLRLLKQYSRLAEAPATDGDSADDAPPRERDDVGNADDS